MLRRWTRALALVMLLGLLPAALNLGIARAQASGGGRAGLVIEHGDGSIDTYCVSFSGNGITGQQLLAKAGIPVIQWNGLACAIGNNPAEGCFHPHDFPSCVCQSYPPTNTYWAFFTQSQDHGWAYASAGLDTAVAHNGDMQAWVWEKGGPNSAPPPPPMTFAQVCPTPTPAPPTPVRATSAPPPTVASTAPAAPTTATPTGAPALLTPSPSPTPTVTASTTATATATPRVRNHGSATATPAHTVDARQASNNGGGSASLEAFLGVAALLLAAILAAIFFRRRQRDR